MYSMVSGWNLPSFIFIIHPNNNSINQSKRNISYIVVCFRTLLPYSYSLYYCCYCSHYSTVFLGTSLSESERYLLLFPKTSDYEHDKTSLIMKMMVIRIAFHSIPFHSIPFHLLTPSSLPLPFFSVLMNNTTGFPGKDE